MALKFSVNVRNAELDAIEVAIGTAAILKIRTGAPPTNISDADTGTVLATLTLPSDWMAAAATGAKAKAGTWEDVAADADGTREEVSETILSGDSNSNEDLITLPKVKGLEPNRIYRIEIHFDIEGDVFGTYFDIHSEY